MPNGQSFFNRACEVFNIACEVSVTCLLLLIMLKKDNEAFSLRIKRSHYANKKLVSELPTVVHVMSEWHRKDTEIVNNHGLKQGTEWDLFPTFLWNYTKNLENNFKVWYYAV